MYAVVINALEFSHARISVGNSKNANTACLFFLFKGVVLPVRSLVAVSSSKNAALFIDFHFYGPLWSTY